MPTWSIVTLDMISPATSHQHLSKFENLQKMLHLTTLFALSVMQCQRRLQISRVKNIDSVFCLSGVAFLLAPPYGGLRVSFDALRADADRMTVARSRS